MQTSKPLWKSFVRAALVLFAALSVMNIALSYALCPYGGLSEAIWYEYRQTPQESIDTIFLGSSFGHRDIDPAAFDESFGSSSFNLSTPGQTLASSYEALQRVAQNPALKRVIYCAGYESFADKPNISASIAFTQAMVQDDPLPLALASYFRLVVANPSYFGSSSSVAALFPWTYSRVPLTVRGIAGNISNRFSYENPLEAAKALDPNISFKGRGFASYEGASDMSLTLGKTAAERYGNTGFREENIKELEAMARFCDERGIDFVVLISPRPVQELLSRGEAYPLEMSLLEARVEALGATFIDFAMADPNYYEPRADELYDYEHLNLAGARRFSALLGTQLAGSDPHQGLFSYDEWDQFGASEHLLNFVSLASHYEEGILYAQASVFSAQSQGVEYRFRVFDYATGTCIHDSGFTTNFQFETRLEAVRVVRVRVDARLVGGQHNPWAYDETILSY